jgi:large subunit ribosomal protein L17
VPKPKKGPRLGSGPAHESLLRGTQCSQLFEHGKIRTTEAKAKAARPLAERMITYAKRGDVTSRRRVLRTVTDREIVHKLFAEIAPGFRERNGGYTRIVKLGPRKGDAAPMAILELLPGEEE